MSRALSFSLMLLLHVLLISAQPVRTNTDVLVGTNLITGQSITGTTYEFSDRISNYELDTTFRTLILQLRGISKNGKYLNNNGVLTSFDLISKDINWIRDMYYGNTSIEQYDGILFYNVGYGSTTRVEMTTGEDMWNSKVLIYATLPGLNVAFGYKYNSFSQRLSEKLSCVDLTTGKVRWERKIDNTYGWDGIKNINDTAVLISASGLHLLNLETGKGWDYNVKTGVKDYSKTVGVNVAGAVLGLLTGSFVYSTGHDQVSDLVSDVVFDDQYMYFASKEYLTCLSYDGKVRWRTSIPEETSSSRLWIDSAKVYMINKGEARYNGREHSFGEPYVAVYDISNGSQLAFSLFELKKNPLLSYINGNDSIHMIFKDRSICYSLKNNDYKTILCDTAKIGELEYSVDIFLTYMKSDSVIRNLHESDPMALYFKSNKSTLVKLNRKLEFEKSTDLREFYVYKGESGSYLFLYHEGAVYVLNNVGRIVAELSVNNRIFNYQDKLYAVDANVLTEIPLNALSNGISN